MTALNKQALRDQSVEGSFYLVECCNCGEMYPSNFLDGGEANADSGDYGDCYCHLCGADDAERADWGDVNSNEVMAWNYQQKRIEALLDELEAAEKRIAELQTSLVVSDLKDASQYQKRIDELERDLKAAENNLIDANCHRAELEVSHAKLREGMTSIYNAICEGGASTSLSAVLTFVKRAFEDSAAAGIKIKGE